MNELTVNGDKRMTVKEVATIFNVDPEAIKKHIRELYPDLMQNGMPTYLTEQQVTEIKRKMIPTTSVVGAVTALEMTQKTMEVILYWQNHAKELENTIVTMQPAHDFGKILLDAVDTYFPMNEASKILEPETGMGRNILFAWLRDKKILRENNTPYQKYIDDGYFRVTEKGTAVGPKAVTMVSNRGIDYIRKLFKKDNEE